MSRPEEPPIPWVATEMESLYRWCIYCAVDCWVDEPEHTAECPSVTNLWPVRPEDIDTACAKCGEPFTPHDFYIHEQIGTPGETPIAMCVCISCAAPR